MNFPTWALAGFDDSGERFLLTDAARQAQGIVYGTLLRQSSMLAFADAFWFMALLFILIIPLMFLMKSVPPAREMPKYGH